MPQDVHDADVLLAVVGELGPVLGHLILVADEAAIDQHGHDDGGDGLRRAEDQLQRVRTVSLVTSRP